MECRPLREAAKHTDRTFGKRLADNIRAASAIFRGIGTSITKRDTHEQRLQRIAAIMYGENNVFPEKGRFAHEMERIGYDHLVPATYLVSTPTNETAMQIKTWMCERKLAFPLFAKPDTGRMGRGACLIRDDAELETFLRQISASYVLQEHRPPSKKEVRYIAFYARGAIYRVCYEKQRACNALSNPYRWSFTDGVRGVETDSETYHALDPIITDIIEKLRQRAPSVDVKQRNVWCFDVGINDRDKPTMYEIQDLFSPLVYLLPRWTIGGMQEEKFMLRQIIQQITARN